MSDLRKLHRQFQERERVNAAATKACTRFGVFVYQGGSLPRYRPEEAVDGKLYKSRKLADKVAAKDVGYAKNHVVRSIDVCTMAERDALVRKKLGLE